VRTFWDRFVGYPESLRRQILAATALLVALIAWLDWKVEPNVSLGFLYIFPILLASGSLARWQAVLLAAGCALLREAFGPGPWQADAEIRIAVSLLVFGAVGLFVAELIRNRAWPYSTGRNSSSRRGSARRPSASSVCSSRLARWRS